MIATTVKVLAAALVAAAMTFAGTAQAYEMTWSDTQTLSATGEPGTEPVVAMNDKGQAVVAFIEPDAAGTNRVRVRFREPGRNDGHFGASVGFWAENDGQVYASQSTSAASNPNVEIDEAGNALVSWNQAGNVYVARGNANLFGSFIDITPHSTGFAGGSDMAMDAQGNAIIGYVIQVSGNPRIESQYRPAGAGNSFGSMQIVWNSTDHGAPGPGGQRVATSPTVGMDSQGNAAFSWSANQNSWNQDPFTRDVWGVFRSNGPQGIWEAGYRFPYSTRGTSTPSRSAGPTEIVVRNGEVLVGWSSSDSSDSRVHVQRKPAGGAWIPSTETLSEVDPRNNFSGHSFGPSLAADDQGNVIANWTDTPGGDASELYENYLGASATTFEPRRRISPEGGRFGGGIVGFDSSGNGLLATLAYGPPGTDSDQWSAGIRFAGKEPTYDADSVVSEKGNFQGSSWAVTASGGALVAWARRPNAGASLDRRIEVRFGTPFTPGTIDPGLPPAPAAPTTPPPPPPPPIPRPNGAIELARPAKSGEATVLTAKTTNAVNRLEWTIGREKVTAGVVDGKLLDSIRLRPDQREAKVSLKAFGPGGEVTLGRTFTLPVPPTDALSKEVDKALDKSGVGDVIAVGEANVLSGRSSACGPVQVISGRQTLTGCFRPIDNTDDLPIPELGALPALMSGLGLPTNRSDLTNRALSLADGYITKSPIELPNGFPAVPSGGASLVSFPQADALTSSKASIKVAGVEVKPPGAGFNLKVDPTKTDIDLGPLPKPPKLPKIGGFDIVGDLDIQLLGGGNARIKGKLRLPDSFKQAGMDAQASVQLFASPDRVIVENASIGPINLDVGAMKVEKLLVRYDAALDEWTGTAKACVVEVACLDMSPPNGLVRLKNGNLEYAGASIAFPPPGIPLTAGVSMEQIGFGVGLNPTRFTGNAKIVFAQILVIDGRLVMAFPDAQTPFKLRRDEVGDGFPAKLYDYKYTGFTVGITADASLRLPVVGDVPLGGAYVLYEYPGYLALGGRVDFAFRTGKVRWIGVKGGIDGEFYAKTGKFNIDGQIDACVVDVICKGMAGNVSSNGMSVCTKVPALVHTLHMGGAIRWSPFKFIPYLDDCKWGRFREANVRSVKAAQAGDGVYTMDREDKDDASEMVMISGQDGAPRVRVTGPGGQVLDSPTGNDIAVTGDAKIRMMRSEEGEFIAVGLAGAREGDYKIEMLPGSVGVKKIEESTALPDAKGGGIVRGTGARRTLAYDITDRPDQKVTFVDVDPSGAANEIKTINGGGRGSFAFNPKPGRQIRRIEARIELDGVPAETLPMARYRPPSPVFARPAGLKVRRRGTKLIVSWKRVRDAKRYELALTPSGSDAQKVYTARRNSLTIKGVSKATAGTVAVTAVAPDRQGRSSSAKFKRTARASSPFRDLKKCKRRGKKLSCR